MIFIMAIYTYFSYKALMPKKNEEKNLLLYKKQTALVIL